jgi:alpha-galactosidase/6-phospho-beta-glucosidase family protein
MPSIKIVCLGAGSYYFPRALGDIAITPGLAGSEVTLYDIDFEKAELMAKLGRRFAKQAGTRVKVRACQELAAPPARSPPSAGAVPLSGACTAPRRTVRT